MRATLVQLDRTIYDRDALEEAARVYAGEDAVTTVVTKPPTTWSSRFTRGCPPLPMSFSTSR